MAPVDETLSLEDIAAGQASLRSLMTAFWGARALHAAVQLGIFTAIAARPLKAADVAEATHTDPRACEALLNALVAMGLLEREEGAFKNSPVSQVLLLDESPYDQSSLVCAFANEWSAWDALDETVRTGAPPRPPAAKRRDQLRAARDLAAVVAPSMAKKIDLSRVGRVLDVGGGPATTAIALAAANPDLQVTILESPENAAISQENVDAAGLGNRVRIDATDPMEADFGRESYDLILLANLHQYPDAVCRALLKKAFEAVVSEGRCVISDTLLRDDKTGPLPATLLALACLVRGNGARAYSGWEVTDAMQTEGFIRVQIVPMDPLAHSLVVGTRP